MRPTPTVLVLAAALALTACGGGTTGGSPDGGGGNTQSLGLTAHWSSIQTKLMPSCTLGNQCHGSQNGSTPTGHEDFSTGNAYANLVGQPSTEQPSVNLVEPGHPEQSYLVNKLDGTQAQVCSQNGDPAFNCGLQMPNGGPYLSQADLDALKQWITDGAQNN